MTNIKGIEIKKSVGIAFVATLMIGIIAGIAISDYLLSDKLATFNIDVQSSIYPLDCSFSTAPSPSEKIYLDRWYNDSIVVTVDNTDDTHAYSILYNITISVTDIAVDDIEMVARVKGDEAVSWPENETLSFNPGTDMIFATFLSTHTTIAKFGATDDTLIAQLFFRIPSSVTPPAGNWIVTIWIVGYEV